MCLATTRRGPGLTDPCDIEGPALAMLIGRTATDLMGDAGCATGGLTALILVCDVDEPEELSTRDAAALEGAAEDKLDEFDKFELVPTPFAAAADEPFEASDGGKVTTRRRMGSIGSPPPKSSSVSAKEMVFFTLPTILRSIKQDFKGNLAAT